MQVLVDTMASPYYIDKVEEGSAEQRVMWNSTNFGRDKSSGWNSY